jgi:drug/metabolite transporter (DMT)-like permease
VLGLFCTAAPLVLYSMLIAEAGAGRALLITYVNPVVAVALGVMILRERPGAGAIAGLLLILAGSWLSTRGTLPTRRPPADPTVASLAGGSGPTVDATPGGTSGGGACGRN